MDQSTDVVGEVLQQFFAVTRSGALFHIRNKRRSEQDWPHVNRIAYRYAAGMVRTNRFIKGPDGAGGLVGITHWRGVLIYWPRDNVDGSPQLPSETTITETRFGEFTSPIVALFLNQEVAETCMMAKDLIAWDSRWRSQTNEVLKTIGKNHPLFVYDPYKGH